MRRPGRLPGGTLREGSYVLPAQSRMRRRDDFTAAVRRGSWAGRGLITGHLLVRADAAGEPARVGFVVARTVGTAVVRNRVRRRLRALVRGYLTALPQGSLLVVRAHPQSARADHADLAAELDLVMGKLMRRQVGTVR